MHVRTEKWADIKIIPVSNYYTIIENKNVASEACKWVWLVIVPSSQLVQASLQVIRVGSWGTCSRRHLLLQNTIKTIRLCTAVLVNLATNWSTTGHTFVLSEIEPLERLQVSAS